MLQILARGKYSSVMLALVATPDQSAARVIDEFGGESVTFVVMKSVSRTRPGLSVTRWCQTRRLGTRRPIEDGVCGVLFSNLMEYYH